MATERITNGTFDSDLTGWTTVDSNPRGLGMGPPGNGVAAWSSSAGGSAQTVSFFGASLVYDAAFFQEIGALYSGATYRLAFEIERRTSGTVQSDDKNSAAVWLAKGSADPILLAVVHTEYVIWQGGFGDPTPLVVTQAIPINTDTAYSADFDISNFIQAFGSGTYTLWIQGLVENSTTSGSNRGFVRFGSVSLLDFAAPEPDIVPTTTRAAVVDQSQSAGASVCQ